MRYYRYLKSPMLIIPILFYTGWNILIAIWARTSHFWAFIPITTGIIGALGASGAGVKWIIEYKKQYPNATLWDIRSVRIYNEYPNITKWAILSYEFIFGTLFSSVVTLLI